MNPILQKRVSKSYVPPGIVEAVEAKLGCRVELNHEGVPITIKEIAFGSTEMKVEPVSRLVFKFRVLRPKHDHWAAEFVYAWETDRGVMEGNPEFTVVSGGPKVTDQTTALREAVSAHYKTFLDLV